MILLEAEVWKQKAMYCIISKSDGGHPGGYIWLTKDTCVTSRITDIKPQVSGKGMKNSA